MKNKQARDVKKKPWEERDSKGNPSSSGHTGQWENKSLEYTGVEE